MQVDSRDKQVSNCRGRQVPDSRDRQVADSRDRQVADSRDRQVADCKDRQVTDPFTQRTMFETSFFKEIKETENIKVGHMTRSPRNNFIQTPPSRA